MRYKCLFAPDRKYPRSGVANRRVSLVLVTAVESDDQTLYVREEIPSH